MVSVLCRYEHNGLVLVVSDYAEAPGPARASRTRAPGAARFQMGEIGLAVTGAGVTATARVTGGNVAFVYGDLLLKDPHADRFYGPVTRRHARASHEGESLGAIRPLWPADLEIHVDLSLGLTTLSDGRSSAFCFALPEGYDLSGRRIDGLYTTTAGGSPLKARLALDVHGKVTRVVGYKPLARRSLPRSLAPKLGDTFTPILEVLTPSADGDGWNVAKALTTPLTFGDEGLVATVQPPLPGDYLAGLVVEDLDGRLTRRYAPLAVAG